jgi:hypothetical protein
LPDSDDEVKMAFDKNRALIEVVAVVAPTIVDITE